MKIKWIIFFIVIHFSFCGFLSAEVIDRIVAIVDDDIVTLGQLNKEALPYIKNIEASGYPDDKKKEMIEKINTKMLNALIDQTLTRQEAQKYQIDVTDTEVNAAVENVKKTKSLSQEDFEQALKQESLTLDEYRGDIKKKILQAKIINHAVKSKVIITESDIEKYYKINEKKYSGKKKYHLRNILMVNEDAAKAVRKELDKNKEFILLAKDHSIAPNALDGGDLGVFDVDNFSQNIKESISKLSKGEYTNVLSTPQGFQIFFVEDIFMDGGKTLKQAFEEIQERLYQEQVEKKFKTWLESLKQKAHIKNML